MTNRIFQQETAGIPSTKCTGYLIFSLLNLLEHLIALTQDMFRKVYENCKKKQLEIFGVVDTFRQFPKTNCRYLWKLAYWKNTIASFNNFIWQIYNFFLFSIFCHSNVFLCNFLKTVMYNKFNFYEIFDITNLTIFYNFEAVNDSVKDTRIRKCFF